MKEITLTQGKVALVDDEDFKYLNQWKWFAANPKGNIWYAKRTDNKNKMSIRMHRVIMGATKKDDFIDHKDQNGLNNQKSNLRHCNRSQNGSNRKAKENKKTKYIGVSWHKTTKKYKTKSGEIRIYESWFYHASIKGNRKQINLGNYKTDTEAALAYNEAANKYHGEFANLNVIS